MERRNWGNVLERLSGGDRTAFVETSRLITGFLARWRAYDFRDEWDDLVQEVILAAVEAHRRRTLRSPQAALGYLRTTARFKFVDWLRRRRGEPLPDERGEAESPLRWPPHEAPPEGGFQIWDRLRELPPTHQKAIVLVYVEGRTYDEAAAESGIPLGSLKRYLREGLAALRESLADFVGVGGPIPLAPATSQATDAGEEASEPRRGKRGEG
jgi:RNA polymerase sigma-70 factor (ECF subfamily)